MIHELLLAGFGGQGMLTVGIALAYAGMMEGRQVAYVPSYGAEMRGGTANCMVTIADREISSPVVASPEVAVVMNRPSLDKFESRIKPGGALLVNSSLVERTVYRSDLRIYRIPTLELAAAGGMTRAANMVMLGALIGVCGAIDLGTVPAALEKAFKGKYLDKLPANMAIVKKGIEYVINVQKESAKRRATA